MAAHSLPCARPSRPTQWGCCDCGQRPRPTSGSRRSAGSEPLADDRNADNPAEEVHHLLGPRKAAQVAVDDNAIEAVINEDEKIAEQLDEGFHGRPPKTHSAWTGQAHGGRQGFPSRR